MRTFLTLPFRDRVGDVPLKPGFWIPRPPAPAPFPLADRGFLRLDRSGFNAGVMVDPFELSVVVMDMVLPLAPVPLRYGFPLAFVTEMPAPPPPPEIATQ